VGVLGAATVTAAQPEPLYGAAVDLGTAPVQPTTFEDMLNAVQTNSIEMNQRRWLDAMALQGAGAAMPGQGVAGAADAGSNIVRAPGQKPGPVEHGDIKNWGDWWTPNPTQIGDKFKFARDKVSGWFGDLVGALGDTDEETGLNRTERKWLDAQDSQDSAIDGLQHDAELDPALVADARRALNTGEWSAELSNAYERYQGKDWANRAIEPFEWVEREVYQPYVADPASALFQQTAGMRAGSDPFGVETFGNLTDADDWRESWERAENVSPGQAAVDPFFLGDNLDEAYGEGFDEFGNPVNQGYRDVREDSLTYNAVSGATDFAIRWYLDPLVVGAKAAGAARAVTRADWDRMPNFARQRIQHIVATPQSRWNDVRSGISPLDPIGQRAVSLRNNMYDLRDKVRADPEHWDAVRIAEEVPAFKKDLLGADLFREVSLARPLEWDKVASASTFKRKADGTFAYDQELFEDGVASMMGNGLARAKLAERKELQDAMYYASTQESKLLGDDLGRLRNVEHYESELARAEMQDGRILAASERWARVRSQHETIEEMSDRGMQLDMQLRTYDSYNRFMSATLDSPDVDFLRIGQFKPRQHKYSRITSRTMRPSNAAGVSATVVHVPRAAWLKRSAAIDLSGHQSLQTQAPRILDEVADAVGDADTLNAFAGTKNFDGWESMRRELLNKAASTRNDLERGAAAHQIEDLALEAVAVKHGFTPDAALQIMQRVKGRQGEIFADIRKRANEAAASGVDADDFRRYNYAEGSGVYHVDMPVSLTQLENYVVPVSAKDMDRFLTIYGDALKNSFKATLAKGKGITTDALDIFNTFWKVGVLFRFGYPMRNVSEETLRILGHTGAFTNLLVDMPKAGAISLRNTGTRVANFVTRHSPAASKWKGARFEYRAHQGQSAKRVVIGPGKEFDASFAPGSGDVWLSLNSSRGSVDRFANLFNDSVWSLRKTQMRTRKTLEGDAGHAEAWAHVLNNQVRYDPIFQKMLHGETNDDIAHWLKYQSAGVEARRRNPVRGADPDKWVDEYRQQLDELVPDDVGDLRIRLADSQAIDVRDLQTIIDDTGRYSPVSIDESALELVTGRGAFADTVYSIIDKGYNALATVPTDVLARNPFFDRQYRHFLQNLVSDLPDNFGPLSAAQSRAFVAQARAFALQQVKRYLFNTVDNDTDLIRWFRFLSPFMGAWKETMLAWGRVVTENPEAFVRLYVNGWESMGDLWGVTEIDSEGRTADDPLHGDLDKISLSLPKGMLKALSYTIPADTGKDFRDVVDDLADEDGAVRMDVNKQTLNTTLQGDPFWLPAGGAIVQLSASAAIGDMPELSDDNAATSFLYTYLFPTGAPSDAWDAIAPTLVRRVRRFAAGNRDPVFSNSATLLHKAAWVEWERNGRVGEPPDKAESVEKAKAIQAAYIVGAAISPFSFELKSDMQFFVDQAHQYQDEFGFDEGYTKFIEDFGDDVYYFWYTNSKNNVGVPPTSEAWTMTKQHRDLIGKYPHIGLALVGMNTQDSPFNYNVYDLQGRTETYPGSGVFMRERQSPEEALAYAQAQEGWKRWREFNVDIDAELVARGIVDLVNDQPVAGNIQRKGAEDLQLLKVQMVQLLRQQYPGWSDAYDSVDKGKSYEVVDEFRGALRSGEMAGRVEWEGVAQYMELHDAVAAELDARAAAGGSANIEVADNEDLFFIFNANAAAIVQDNLAFADVYHRFLDRHTLTNGSNGARLGA
jgi:hypothetical protein